MRIHLSSEPQIPRRCLMRVIENLGPAEGQRRGDRKVRNRIELDYSCATAPATRRRVLYIAAANPASATRRRVDYCYSLLLLLLLLLLRVDAYYILLLLILHLLRVDA